MSGLLSCSVQESMGLPNTNLGSEPRKAVGRMDVEHVPRGSEMVDSFTVFVPRDKFRFIPRADEAILLVTTANGVLLLSTIY